MNEPTDASGAGPRDAKPIRDFVTRTDLSTAALVDEGLALLRTHGLEYASTYLSAQMVPLAVARRALMTPPERRGTRRADPNDI